jgi:hypothetical protein
LALLVAVAVSVMTLVPLEGRFRWICWRHHSMADAGRSIIVSVRPYFNLDGIVPFVC